MPSDDKPATPNSSPPVTPVEPPKIYFAACGVMCDIFWWARSNPPRADEVTVAAPFGEKKA
jgi:hypothetical protein